MQLFDKLQLRVIILIDSTDYLLSKCYAIEVHCAQSAVCTFESPPRVCRKMSESQAHTACSHARTPSNRLCPSCHPFECWFSSSVGGWTRKSSELPTPPFFFAFASSSFSAFLAFFAAFFSFRVGPLGNSESGPTRLRPG